MTTVTKRLGLEVMSTDVAEWLDSTFFDAATLPFGSPYPHDESVSISIEKLEPLPAPTVTNNEYRVAVATYERHDALVPSGSFLADEVVPTIVRPSAPRIEVPAEPAKQPATHRVSNQAATPAPPRQGSRLMAVVWVLLAAAVAATAVYFLIPLLI